MNPSDNLKRLILDGHCHDGYAHARMVIDYTEDKHLEIRFFSAVDDSLIKIWRSPLMVLQGDNINFQKMVVRFPVMINER